MVNDNPTYHKQIKDPESGVPLSSHKMPYEPLTSAPGEVPKTKRCSRCKQVKPISEFSGPYLNGKYATYDRTCASDYARTWFKNHPNAVNEWRKKNAERWREVDRIAKARHRMLHRDRQVARQMVTQSLINGTLKRRPCEVCGSTEKVEAHHDDYSRPLEVRWLCFPHHKAWHKANKVSKQVAA